MMPLRSMGCPREEGALHSNRYAFVNDEELKELLGFGKIEDLLNTHRGWIES